MTPQEDRPMDPLTELLATALPDGLNGRLDAAQSYVIAKDIVAAIDPAKADAMRAGLLLAELGAMRPAAERLVTLQRFGEDGWWSASDQPRGDPDSDDYTSASAPTLLAAITDLLAKLEARP